MSVKNFFLKFYLDFLHFHANYVKKSLHKKVGANNHSSQLSIYPYISDFRLLCVSLSESVTCSESCEDEQTAAERGC